MSRRLTSAWCTFRDIVKKWRLLRFEWLGSLGADEYLHFVVCVVIALNSLYIGFFREGGGGPTHCSSLYPIHSVTATEQQEFNELDLVGFH